MSEWTLTVPAPCDWINLNQRMHWASKARLTKGWRTAAHVYARQVGLPRGLERVHITIAVTKPTARAYDVHNLMPTAKACVDGLVDYGLTVDDSNAFVVGPDMRPGGKGPAALIITIAEVTLH